MFIDNKYTHIYNSIIKKAKLENRRKSKKEYFEEHHILPKSIFPEYSNLRKFKHNAVLLTAKEHFICHLLLTKMIHPSIERNKLLLAFEYMNNIKGRKINSLLYSKIRTELAKIYSERSSGNKNPMYGKSAVKNSTWYTNGTDNILLMKSDEIPVSFKRGRVLSEEHKANMKLAPRNTANMKGNFGEKNGMFNKERTSEERKLISIRTKENMTDEIRQKISQKKIGKIFVKKDDVCISITKDQLQNFLDNNWIRGRIIRK